MDFGKHQLAKATFAGNDYYLVVNKVDADGGMVQWAFYITKGSWQVAAPEIIASPQNVVVNNINAAGQIITSNTVDPQPMIDAAIASMNTVLSGLFAPAPAPTSFIGTADDDCFGIIFSIANGTVQLKKQNFGANPGLNKYLAKITGYQGDFVSGQFGAWASADNIDVQSLIVKYNSLSGS